MARKAREKSNSGIYHVVVTGEDSVRLFEEFADYDKYISLLAEYSDVCGFKLYAYCLLENHVHLLINDNGGDISNIMKRIGTSYVYWFNSKYDRQGKLFADRFKSQPVESEDDFKRALKYIHLDPVESGIASAPQDYGYSSYTDYFASQVVSSDMARRVFGGVRDFTDFHSGPADKCIDITHRENILTDEQLEAVFVKEFSVTAEKAAELPKDTQSEIYGAITERYNVSIRQIARVTKLNLTKIWRLTAKGREVCTAKS